MIDKINAGAAFHREDETAQHMSIEQREPEIMKTVKSECDTCPIKGYSTEICKLHMKHMSNSPKKSSDDPSSETPECTWKVLGKKAAVGAGIGVVGSFAGLGILPALGLKAVLGHSLVSMSSACGALGAGTNVAMHQRKKCLPEVKKKKKNVLLPNRWRIESE